MNQKLIEEIAGLLYRAEQSQSPCPPVRDLIREAAGDDELIAAAYAVQRRNTGRRLAAGGRLVGRKIGLTSLAVQKQLGVDAPDFGMLFADMAIGDAEEIPLSRTCQPKVEAEIALVLERDLAHERHTFADIISATAYALPAIEVVGSRIANWDIGLADTIADNASSAGVVLGAARVAPADLDPADIEAVLYQDGAEVARGNTSAVLGDPTTAVAWLARTVASFGVKLEAGHVILPGSCTRAFDVRAGSDFRAEFTGLGSVALSFTTPTSSTGGDHQ